MSKYKIGDRVLYVPGAPALNYTGTGVDFNAFGEIRVKWDINGLVETFAENSTAFSLIDPKLFTLDQIRVAYLRSSNWAECEDLLKKGNDHQYQEYLRLKQIYEN